MPVKILISAFPLLLTACLSILSSCSFSTYKADSPYEKDVHYTLKVSAIESVGAEENATPVAIPDALLDICFSTLSYKDLCIFGAENATILVLKTKSSQVRLESIAVTLEADRYEFEFQKKYKPQITGGLHAELIKLGHLRMIFDRKSSTQPSLSLLNKCENDDKLYQTLEANLSSGANQVSEMCLYVGMPSTNDKTSLWRSIPYVN